MMRNSRQSNGILDLVVKHERPARTVAVLQPPVLIKRPQSAFRLACKIGGQLYRYLDQAVVVRGLNPHLQDWHFSERILKRRHRLHQEWDEYGLFASKPN